MKIKTQTMSYEEVMALSRPARKKPRRPSRLRHTLIRVRSAFDLRAVHFTYTRHGMEKISSREPVLILMNHSSFIDLDIASRIFYPRCYGIVTTSDAFVGKEGLMRRLGCIPTRKFVTDIPLLLDMEYMLKTLHSSVLLYPEASYSFDGTATALPRKMGVLLKKLDVPVVMVMTHGAFARDPLYNMLQRRQVDVSADVTCLLTPEQLRTMSVAELDALLDQAFTFDNFRWQQENDISIREPFRADGLNRILYKCAHCGAEGQMEGKGIHLTCHACGKQYELTEKGFLRGLDGVTEFDHVPDWYAWERAQVREALADGCYRLEAAVDIGMMVDYKSIYMVGSGTLVHDAEGFRLTGCDGKLEYTQRPLASYGLYSDYYWYEIGDVICIGDQDALYYCFPREGDVVAKARMAAQELYTLKRQQRANAGK